MTLLSSQFYATLPTKHDLTHSPVALYQFESNLNDSSGNGLHLTNGGTQPTKYGDMTPGMKGVVISNSTTFFERASNDPLLTITEAVTIEAIINIVNMTADGTIGAYVVSFGGNSGLEVDNLLYSLFMKSTTSPPLPFGIGIPNGDMDMSWEYGAVPTTVTYRDTINFVPRGVPVHIAITRSSGPNPIVRTYISGTLTSTSAAFVGQAATGGTTSRLRIGIDQTESAQAQFFGIISSVKIIASQLSDSDVKAEYNRTLGLLYGLLP